PPHHLGARVGEHLRERRTERSRTHHRCFDHGPRSSYRHCADHATDPAPATAPDRPTAAWRRGWQDDPMALPDDRVHVVIPVKSLDRAKSRLGPQMSGSQRRALVLAMFLDTLAAAQSAEVTGQVTVVTGDHAVAAAAVA